MKQQNVLNVLPLLWTLFLILTINNIIKIAHMAIEHESSFPEIKEYLMNYINNSFTTGLDV